MDRVTGTQKGVGRFVIPKCFFGPVLRYRSRFLQCVVEFMDRNFGVDQYCCQD